MTQTERVESFGRFQSARVALRSETSDFDDDTPEDVLLPSGAVFGAERYTQQGVEPSARHWERIVTPILLDASASSEFLDLDLAPNEIFTTWDDLTTEVTHAKAFWWPAVAPRVFPDASLGSIGAVIVYATMFGLTEIAQRLEELAYRPLEEDEVPLDTNAAMHFVQYCVSREKFGPRPSLAVTPMGELDVTWTGPENETVTMRFFPGGLVWIAYKLEKARGSFETSKEDLLATSSHFTLPDWA